MNANAFESSAVSLGTGAAGGTAPAGPARDLVFTFWMDSWADVAKRGFHAPDRLVTNLLGSPRVRRLLLADPYRSAPVRAARRALGQLPPFPGEPGSRTQYTPLRLRRHDPTATDRIERSYRAYGARLRRAASRHALDRPTVITTNAFVAAFCSLEWARSVVYYFWDDWAALPALQTYWPALEAAYERIAARGVDVCAVSQTLLDRLQPQGRTLVMPNGVQPEEWRPPWKVPNWFLALPGPRLLYVGALDSRLDVDALREVAERFSSGSVVLVGPEADRDALESLRASPNILTRPPENRSAIAGLVSAADACLLLHRRTRLTDAMSPVKLFEYLAGGAPVAATALPPVRGWSDRVVLVEDGDRASDAVLAAIDRGRAPEAERQAAVDAHSWARRHESILDFAFS